MQIAHGFVGDSFWESVLKPTTPLSEACVQADGQCLKTLAGRVMPEMFTACMKPHSDSEGTKASDVSEAVTMRWMRCRFFSQPADSALLENLFETIAQRLLKAVTDAKATDSAQASPLADLANALVSHLPVSALDFVEKVFTPFLSWMNGAMLQKSAYRVSRSIVEHDSSSKFPAERFWDSWVSLRGSRQTCEAPAREIVFTSRRCWC